MKRKVIILTVFSFFIFLTFIFPQELKTGAQKKFVPGDKVVFFENFSSCPVGEIPSSFEKVEGMGECVRYGNEMYFSSITREARLIKKINLGSDEFSIEFDLLFLKGECGEATVELFEGNEPGRGRSIIWVSFGPGCSGEAVYLGIKDMGNIFRSSYKSLKKKIHVAIQVRRKQLRVFMNGKRLVMKQFNGSVTSMMFKSVGKYAELITNIKIAKYSRAEEKPKPEDMGIKVEKTAHGTKLTIPENILFDINKFFLKPEAKKALRVVSELLREDPKKRILITGYTDNIGSDSYNLQLSLQRAQSVADYLIYVEGINPSRIKIEGKGKANPIADNSTEKGRAKNRRVEIKIY